MVHGGHWESVEADTDAFIEEMLPKICHEGALIGQNDFIHAMEDVEVKQGVAFGLEYPEAPLNFLAVVVSGISPDNNELWTAYPVCTEGALNKLVIEKINPIENGIEGTVETVTEDQGEIVFFDPYFFINKDRYQVGSEMDISLAALAYSVKKRESLDIEITEGALLDIHRENMVKNDPNVDVSNITSVPISMDGAAIYFPRGELNDDAELMFKVTETSSFECEGRLFEKMTGTILRTDNSDSVIHMYASEQTLGGYKPQVGDNVEAVVWMQGFLHNSEAA